MAGDKVLLGTIQIVAFTSVQSEVRVKMSAPFPGIFKCPSVFRCGAPAYTRTWLTQPEDFLGREPIVSRSFINTTPCANACDPTDAATEAPLTLQLEPNFPNPFNPTTRIVYALPRATHAHLSIHNVHGRLIATLVDAREDAGRHSVTWNGRDRNGRQAASGVYLVLLRIEGDARARKILLVK